MARNEEILKKRGTLSCISTSPRNESQNEQQNRPQSEIGADSGLMANGPAEQ